jgi:hypothetical protein
MSLMSVSTIWTAVSLGCFILLCWELSSLTFSILTTRVNSILLIECQVHVRIDKHTLRGRRRPFLVAQLQSLLPANLLNFCARLFRTGASTEALLEGLNAQDNTLQTVCS